MRKLSKRQVKCAGVALAIVAAILALDAKGARAQVTVEALIGPAVSDSGNAQYQDVADAITRFQNGDLKAARDLLERAKKKNAKLPPAEVLLARLLLSAGQMSPARAELEKAVVSSPTDPEAYLIFADIALREGRNTDAEALYMKSKALNDPFKENPKRQRNFDMRVNAGMAGVAEARAQWEVALQFLKTWLQLDPDSAAAHQRIGRSDFKLNKDTDAYQEFQTAAKLDPDIMNPDILMAHMYEDAQKRDSAAKFIQQAVSKNPQNPKVLMDAALWAMVTNRLTEAQTYADAAIKANPKSVEAEIVRGQVARMTGDLKTAETMLEQAHLQAPSNLDAANQLAIALADQNDPAKQKRAFELAEMNVRLSSQGNQFNSEAVTTLAWVYYKMGKGQEAEQLIARVLQKGVLNADIAFYAAKILQERGKTDEATKLLEASLNSSTSFVQRKNATDLLSQLNSAKKPETPASK